MRHKLPMPVLADRADRPTDYATDNVVAVARDIHMHAAYSLPADRRTATRVLARCLRSLDTVAAAHGLPLYLTPRLQLALAKLCRQWGGRGTTDRRTGGR